MISSLAKVAANGRVGAPRPHADDEAATLFAEKQEASKRKVAKSQKGGCVDPNIIVSSSSSSSSGKNKKRKAAAAAPSSPPRRKGLASHAPPADDDAIDNGIAGVDAALASSCELHSTLRARLALIDPSSNRDNSIITSFQFSLLDTYKKKKAKRCKKKGRRRTPRLCSKKYSRPRRALPLARPPLAPPLALAR